MDSSLDTQIAGNSAETLALIFCRKSGFHLNLLQCDAATSFAVRTNSGYAPRFKEGFKK
jgi:hypothetical protein